MAYSNKPQPVLVTTSAEQVLSTLPTNPQTGAAAASKGCRLMGIYPAQTMTGTITLYDEATTGATGQKFSFAIGLTMAGITFGPDGVCFLNGLGVKHSVGESCTYVIAPLY